MPSEGGLFGGLYRAGEVAAQLSDEAWLQAMLDFEAALARACAAEGEITEDAARAVVAACQADRFDLSTLGREAADHATPVVPLVRALREAVGEPHAHAVHLHATSQDTIDTAAMLVSQRALRVITDDCFGAQNAAAAIARRHVHTPMVGRTLLQAALPVSFGLVAAGWAYGVGQAAGGLASLDDHLVVQLGGPVGSVSPRLAARLGVELGLDDAPLPWHTNRVLPARLAVDLGVLAGALGKVARDVTLLAQQEVSEVREGGPAGRGASSAMAHKRNPVASVSALACTKRVPGLVATMLASMEQEHQRAAGAWQAEWGTLTDLLGLTGSAAHWARDLLENLEIDTERMRENLRGLAASGVPEAEDPEAHLDAAEELIKRALGSVGT